MDATTYDAAFSRLIANEGATVTRDASDPGGTTKYGISQRSYPDKDIANLSEADARAIYWTDWWLKYAYGQLSAAIGIKVFDAAVNMGAPAAHRCLQHALRSCGITVDDDGVLGDATRNAVSQVDAERLLAAFRSELAGHYRVLIAAKPVFTKYQKGWLNRAYQ